MVTNRISCVVPPYLLSGIAENDKNKEHIRQPAPNAEPGTWLKKDSESKLASEIRMQLPNSGENLGIVSAGIRSLWVAVICQQCREEACLWHFS
ncbi:hypothetical protein PG990_015377 [Apiospora arundinis]